MEIALFYITLEGIGGLGWREIRNKNDYQRLTRRVAVQSAGML
jgi:hypothetical protein